LKKNKDNLSKHSLNLTNNPPVINEKSSLRYLDDNSSFSSISLSSAPSLSGTNPVLSLYPGTTHTPNNQSKFWVIEEEDENIIDKTSMDSNLQKCSFNSTPSQFLRSSSSQQQNQNNGIASILNNGNSNLSGIVMSSTTTNMSVGASTANRDYHSYCYGADKTKNNIRQDFRNFSPIHFNQLNNNNNNIGLASILPSGSRSLSSTPVHSSSINPKNAPANINVNAFRSFSPVRGQPTDKGGTHPYIIRNQEFGPAVHFTDKNIFGGVNSRSSTPINQTLSENIVQTQDVYNNMGKAQSTPMKGKGTLHNHPKIPNSSESTPNLKTPQQKQSHSMENPDFSNIGVFYKSSAEKVPVNIKNYMLNIINNYMKGMHIDPKKKDTNLNQYNANININMKNLFQTIIDYLNDEIVNISMFFFKK